MRQLGEQVIVKNGDRDKQSKKRKKKNSKNTTDNEQLLDKAACDLSPISKVIGQAES